MRILFVSPVVPEPPTDGGRQRVHHLLDALAQSHELTFTGITRGDAPVRWKLADSFTAPPIFVDLADQSPAGGHKVLAKYLGLTWLEQPAVLRRIGATALWSRLQSLPLSSFDAVHVETMALAPFALALKTQVPQMRAVLDLPDVASHFNARLLKPASWLTGTGFSDLVDLGRLVRFERKLIPGFDAVITCSTVDASRLHDRVRSGRLHVVPNCTVTDSPPLAPSSGSQIVFVGTMSYAPNEEGVLYFCDKVLPIIRQAIPDATFWIVGKSPSAAVKALTHFAGIHVTGAVADVRPYLAQAAITVVPLLSGGGTRLKILEAMSAGRAVVSTSVGAEGLEVTDGDDVLLADTPIAIGAACVSLLRDHDKRHRLEKEGRGLVERKYDWSVARQGLQSIYAGLA